MLNKCGKMSYSDSKSALLGGNYRFLVINDHFLVINYHFRGPSDFSALWTNPSKGQTPLFCQCQHFRKM